uniref:Uncharacterized protein n=1 Tax=Meloidogyne javanica TaxID=6303 RepID=A0A915LDZ8_MELJA
MKDDKQEFIDQETINIKKYNRSFYKPTGLTHDQNLTHPYGVKLMRVDLEKTTETIKALNDVLAANRKKIEAKEKGKKWAIRSTKKDTLTEELVELNKIKENVDDDLKILELYLGICKRMNFTVENILNNIKEVEESLKPLTEKLNYLKKNTKNYLPNVLLAYEKLYEHYGLAYEDHEKKHSPETLDEEEQQIEDIKYSANLVKELPHFGEEKFDSFMLDWFQKFY